MPTEVGVEKKIYVYGEYTRARVNVNRERGYTLRAAAMRCSNATADFIYKFTKTDYAQGCCFGFCGMNA